MTDERLPTGRMMRSPEPVRIGRLLELEPRHPITRSSDCLCGGRIVLAGRTIPEAVAMHRRTTRHRAWIAQQEGA